MKKILWCGDSTMTGGVLQSDGTWVITPYSEMQTCTDLLNQKHGSGSVVSVNAAYGGTTTIDWLHGNVAYEMPNFTTRMSQSLDVNIVVIQLGINDAFNPAISVQNYKDNIAELYRIGHDLWGKTVVFATPSPINRPENSKLYNLQYALKEVQSLKGFRVIDHYIAATTVGPSWMSRLPDGIHPDEYLHRFKGNTSFLLLSDLI